METVAFDGVEYVKASVIAKRFRYTSDYVGQLCRAKKVDARLVGRTWFVNPDSLELHKLNKYVDSATATKDVVKAEMSGVRREVPPMLTSKTTKVALDMHNFSTEPSERKLSIAYETDEERLIPALNRKHLPPARPIRIEAVGAKHLTIKGKSEVGIYTPTEIPEVALSGDLKVSDYPEEIVAEESSENTGNTKNKAISAEKPVEKVVSEPVQKKLTILKPKVIVVKESHFDIEKVQPKIETVSDTVMSKQKDGTKVVTPSIKAGVVDMMNVSVVAPAADEAAEARTIPSFAPVGVQTRSRNQGESLLLQISPLLASVLALVFVLGILSSSNLISVSGNGYESGVVFQLSNLIGILKP